MKCTQIIESDDPNTWTDNYFCAPIDSPLSFTWSSAGNTCGGDGSVQILELADPHKWDDNYLCWSFDEGAVFSASRGDMFNILDFVRYGINGNSSDSLANIINIFILLIGVLLIINIIIIICFGIYCCNKNKKGYQIIKYDSKVSEEQDPDILNN